MFVFIFSLSLVVYLSYLSTLTILIDWLLVNMETEQ